MAGSIKKTSVYVIDASLMLSALLPDEKMLEEYKKYFRLFEEGQIVLKSSELLKYEVGNSLKSAFRQKRIGKKLSGRLYDDFLKMNIKYTDLDFKEVLNLSINKNLSFYDASYLYLAKANKCKLLTLDKGLSKMLQWEYMAANLEIERPEMPQVREHLDEFPETIQQIQGAKVEKTFKSQVRDDKGIPIIQTPPAQVITVQPPSSQLILTQQAKGSTTSSFTWLAAFWLRIIKKALHFGWQVVGG